jgi:hypothetical protein
MICHHPMIDTSFVNQLFEKKKKIGKSSTSLLKKVRHG